MMMVVIVLTGVHRKLALESHQDQVEEDFEQTAHNPVLSAYHLFKAVMIENHILVTKIQNCVYSRYTCAIHKKNVNLVWSKLGL